MQPPVFFVIPSGFEPEIREPESLVLPLHYGTIFSDLINLSPSTNALMIFLFHKEGSTYHFLTFVDF